MLKVYAINRFGGTNNSDLIIHFSGEGFNILRMFCQALLDEEAHTVCDRNSTCARACRLAEQLHDMMNPIDPNPLKFFDTELRIKEDDEKNS